MNWGFDTYEKSSDSSDWKCSSCDLIFSSDRHEFICPRCDAEAVNYAPKPRTVKVSKA